MKINIDQYYLDFLRRLSRFSGAFVFLMGATVLLGWALATASRGNLFYAFPPMSPNTAVSLIIGGSALLWAPVIPWPELRFFFRLACSAALFLIGSLALIEHLHSSQSIWINHALIDFFLSRSPQIAIARAHFPIVSSGVCIVSFSLSLLLMEGKGPAWQIALTPCVLVPFASLIGQTFHMVLFGSRAEKSPFMGMAAHVSIAFFSAAAGLLASRPEEGFFRRILDKSPAGDVLRIFTAFAFFVPAMLTIAAFVLENTSTSAFHYVYAALITSIIIGFLMASVVAIRKLEQSEGKFFELMNQAGDGIFLLKLDGELTEVNTAALELLGYNEKKDVVGKFIYDIIHPKDFFRLDSARTQLAKPGFIHRGEWLVRKSNGKFFPADVCAKILPGNTMQVIARDISKKYKEERQLRFLSESAQIISESTHYQGRVEAISDLIVPKIADYCVIFSKIGDQLHVSAATHRDPQKRGVLLAIANEFPPRLAIAIGQSVNPQEKLIIYEKVSTSTYGEFAENEKHYSLMSQLGTKSYITAPLITRGQIIGTISMGITSSDRSFQKSESAFFNQVIHRFATALDNARLYQEATHAIRAREDILAVVSHDLKSPIAVVALAAQIAVMRIEAGVCGKPVLDYLAKIRLANKRMLRMVEMLLNVGKLQAGTFAAKPTAMDMHALFNDVKEVFFPLAAQAKVDLEFDPQPGANFLGDLEALSQALSNLVGNAIKASKPENKVTVRGYIDSHRQVNISVEDEGQGIPEEQLPRLFERYWQPEKSRSCGGSGLGLFIVKGVIDAHRGKVTVKSKVGHGSTFTITFPANLKEEESVQAAG